MAFPTKFVLKRLCRFRSFKRTLIFLVVILVQVWLAIPVLFSQPGESWPETFDVSMEPDFASPLVPIVVFSSYRPTYLEKTLKSISASGSVEPTTPCLFVLHQTKSATMDDINETYKVLAKITFCRKLVMTFGNDNEERSSLVLKAHWWNVMKRVFDDKDTFQLKINATFDGDVLFIEDDTVVSPDFMEAMWYSLKVKNSVRNVMFSTLQGTGAENMVEHQPDSFIISRVPVLQSICYAFNSSTWNYLKQFEKDALDYSRSDWPLSLGLLLFFKRNETVQIVTPTISRVWHVGQNKLSSTHGNVQSTQRTEQESLPPWKRAKEQGSINLDKAEVLDGIRDMYGRLCHPCELESRSGKSSARNYHCHCLCPTSNLKKYWNWQVAAFGQQKSVPMSCALVSHLMIMVVCIIVGLLMFGYLMASY